MSRSRTDEVEVLPLRVESREGNGEEFFGSGSNQNKGATLPYVNG